jgi:hypothetical protein
MERSIEERSIEERIFPIEERGSLLDNTLLRSNPLPLRFRA